jgi:adenine-specific DNA-methyltransferase
MPKKNTNGKAKKSVESIRHADALRKHIPTAEYQSVLSEEQQTPIQVAYARRNPDLDPQLVWRGKDMQDWSDLVVQAPPIYIQEKVHPKVLMDDLRRQTEEKEKVGKPQQFDMFADFNGLPETADKTEFYQHDANWTNRMILGDSLQVMASLTEREGLRGKVQCIYIDPPYGIKFNSNFQWSTTSRDVKDGKTDHITREPEQVKAFRDTWRDGIHSYLTYLRDRLIVARELLSDSGSIFVQIGDENVHRVRAVMDEVFGDQNSVVTIYFRKTTTQNSDFIADTNDYLLWYVKDKGLAKFRALLQQREGFDWVNYDFVMSDDLRLRKITKAEKQGIDKLDEAERVYRRSPLTSTSASESTLVPFDFAGQTYRPGKGGWKTNLVGLTRLSKSYRIETYGTTVSFRRFTTDFPFFPISNSWIDTASGGYGADKTYVVQTNVKVIERCILMTTDPGDLVIDPSCGSGTTAYVAEQWGRRWITIDTSRVALALARARIMGARYPYYVLKDSRDGQLKEAELARNLALSDPTYGNIRQGFVYERVPHVMLRTIANNAEIDVIHDAYQEKLEPVRAELNKALSKTWEEWELPREVEDNWSEEAKKLHGEWWQLRIARQKEIDASISAKADYKYLYDKPYEDNKKVRVAGPFTVESLSPHRTLGVDENDELIDNVAEGKAGYAPGQSFEQMILENLKTAGVQQAHKEDKINFFSLTPWPGHYICAEGRYLEGSEEKGRERRAGIFIGPEFGTVSRPDLVAAAREAGDAGFDVLVTCAFNYDARSTEFSKLGNIPVLKARMNADLHMADDLRNTGKGNLFVIFGEPDIKRIDTPDGKLQIKINGVDVFHPGTGKVESNGADGIACWFIDTDYNEESFFVRHAYFLGANDPYSSLKTTLKAEINEEAWASLNSDISRPFDKPASGRIAVKVINHLGDEVMKVFRV